MSAGDVHILHQLRDGNVQAFKSLFDKHYKAMVLKAWTMLNDEMEAEDLVQKLFADLWENQFWKAVKYIARSLYVYRFAKPLLKNHPAKENARRKRIGVSRRTDFVFGRRTG